MTTPEFPGSTARLRGTFVDADYGSDGRNPMKVNMVGIAGREIIGSGPDEPLEGTVILTGVREWGEVKIRAAAGGPDATAIAGWKALMRLREVEVGTVEESWVASIDRTQGESARWEWTNTGRTVESQPATLNLDQFATLIGARREEAARRLTSGLIPEEAGDAADD